MVDVPADIRTYGKIDNTRVSNRDGFTYFNVRDNDKNCSYRIYKISQNFKIMKQLFQIEN